MSSTEQLTHAQAERWRTDWKVLDMEAVGKRLRRLYELRDFAMVYGDSIPVSWQQFLIREIALGEARCEELGEAA